MPQQVVDVAPIALAEAAKSFLKYKKSRSFSVSQHFVLSLVTSCLV